MLILQDRNYLALREIHLEHSQNPMVLAQWWMTKESQKVLTHVCLSICHKMVLQDAVVEHHFPINMNRLPESYHCLRWYSNLLPVGSKFLSCSSSLNSVSPSLVDSDSPQTINGLKLNTTKVMFFPSIAAQVLTQVNQLIWVILRCMPIFAAGLGKTSDKIAANNCCNVVHHS